MDLKYKEHFPKSKGSKLSLCGQKNAIIIEHELDNDPEMFCLKCVKLACEDCYGSGFMGQDHTETCGIYCSCKYGDYARYRNNEVDEDFINFVAEVENEAF